MVGIFFKLRKSWKKNWKKLEQSQKKILSHNLLAMYHFRFQPFPADTSDLSRLHAVKKRICPYPKCQKVFTKSDHLKTHLRTHFKHFVIVVELFTIICPVTHTRKANHMIPMTIQSLDTVSAFLSLIKTRGFLSYCVVSLMTSRHHYFIITV